MQSTIVRNREDFLGFLRTFAAAWEATHLEELSPDEAPLALISSGNLPVGELVQRLVRNLEPSSLPTRPDWQMVADVLMGSFGTAASTSAR